MSKAPQFGDKAAIKKLREEGERKRMIENSNPCDRCSGTGNMEHDCDCDFCTNPTQECDECGGTGRIKKGDGHGNS